MVCPWIGLRSYGVGNNSQSHPYLWHEHRSIGCWPGNSISKVHRPLPGRQVVRAGYNGKGDYWDVQVPAKEAQRKPYSRCFLALILIGSKAERYLMLESPLGSETPVLVLIGDLRQGTEKVFREM